ncbi:MAG: T9SS type A sorting domain-containing protein [Ignavibacteria bacterium]
MKKWIIFFVFLLCINNVYSQTWERAFGFIFAKEEGAYTICKLTTGDFIVAGFGEDYLPSVGKFVKMNSLGDTLFSKKIDIPGVAFSRIYTSLTLDNGYFLLGGDCSLNNDFSNPTAFLGKFNSQGNPEWIKNYYANGIQYYFDEIIQANDGGFIAKGIDYILKVDENGNYLWHKSILYYNVYTILSLHSSNDGYLMTVSNYPSLVRNIIRLNNSGEVIWKKNTYNFFYPGTVIIGQNKFFAFGGKEDTVTHNTIFEIQSYDTSGNYISTKSLNVQRKEIGSGFLLQINPNRILFSSITPLTPAVHYCALRLVDTNMNLIRSLDLTTTGGFRGLYSAVMQDSNYIVTAGNISLHLGYGYEDFYVVKTDTNLNLQVSIGIKKLEAGTPDAYSLHQNFPNPFNPFTSIKFTLPEESFVKVEIFDITGKLTDKIVEKKMAAGTYEAVWYGTDKPSGIYFCKMTAGKYTKTIRMVMVK